VKGQRAKMEQEQRVLPGSNSNTTAEVVLRRRPPTATSTSMPDDVSDTESLDPTLSMNL
jgi:hypothetical protein